MVLIVSYYTKYSQYVWLILVTMFVDLPVGIKVFQRTFSGASMACDLTYQNTVTHAMEAC